MTKAHLISVTTAITLGYAAGFATDGIVSATSVPAAISGNVDKGIDKANAAVVNIRSKTADALCALSETKHGLDSGDCAAANVCNVSLNYCDADGVEYDEVGVSGQFVYPGSHTLSEPQ